jgi:5-oxoprolinase (ATP-hydrolysing)
MKYIQDNAEQSVRKMLVEAARRIGDQEEIVVEAEDQMDDGSKMVLKLTLNCLDETACFDFTGTDPEMFGNCNAPRSITSSAIIYCLRSLVNTDIPLNQGCLKPVRIIVPEGCFLNPSAQAAVVGGNVLTSQRVTDLVLRAFRACAASQGCMNNFTFGDQDFGYYETIAGGHGAGPGWQGQDGVHTHMTNTRITDPEVLEIRYPVCLRQFTIRDGSGGLGQYKGGDGVIREVEFLKDNIEIGLLSERRAVPPWGMAGGCDGATGKNLLIHPDGRIQNFGAKNTTTVKAGTRIRIMTPGAGGYGEP